MQRRTFSLPEPVLDANGKPIVCACPICGAMNIGAPPHGEGEPCPVAVQKANQEAFMFNDLKKMMAKMGIFEEEDDS